VQQEVPELAPPVVPEVLALAAGPVVLAVLVALAVQAAPLVVPAAAR
jgi:hypothetical protein